MDLPAEHPHFKGVVVGVKSWFNCFCGYAYSSEDQASWSCPKCKAPRPTMTQLCVWGSDQAYKTDDPVLAYDSPVNIEWENTKSGLAFGATQGIDNLSRKGKGVVEIRWRGETANQIYNSRSMWKDGRCVEQYQAVS